MCGGIMEWKEFLEQVQWIFAVLVLWARWMAEPDGAVASLGFGFAHSRSSLLLAFIFVCCCDEDERLYKTVPWMEFMLKPEVIIREQTMWKSKVNPHMHLLAMMGPVLYDEFIRKLPILS